MARRPRIHIAGLSVHVFPRGINRGAIVRDDGDRRHLLGAIVRATRRHDVDINAFAVMDTHYHLVLTPSSQLALSRTMQSIGGSHTLYFNRKYERIGTLWNERYGDTLLDDERYWYNCLKYVDLNPFRAGIVAAPEDSPWSSYRFHAYGDPCDWLTPHPLYLRLGVTSKERQTA